MLVVLKGAINYGVFFYLTNEKFFVNSIPNVTLTFNFYFYAIYPKILSTNVLDNNLIILSRVFISCILLSNMTKAKVTRLDGVIDTWRLRCFNM